MVARELHLELLVGKRVLGLTGSVVGRIEEVRAIRHGDEWVVAEYLVGSGALLQRLSAWWLALFLVRMGARQRQGYRVAWDQLDLSDPEHPRLRCPRDDLRPIVADGEPEHGADREPDRW